MLKSYQKCNFFKTLKIVMFLNQELSLRIDYTKIVKSCNEKQNLKPVIKNNRKSSVFMF